MFNNFSIKIITVLAVVAILGIGSYAFAEWGGGYGHHGYGRHHMYDSDEGYGYGHHGYGRGYGPGCDYGDDLTQEEIEKLQAQREAFHKDTRKLRRNINQKELALRSELVKENPDTQRALEIQKEISDLRAQMDQKRVDHLIKIRKIAPDAGRGMMKGFGSRGGGRGMGPGSGDRPCWR
jgi:hypothetical protein